MGSDGHKHTHEHGHTHGSHEGHGHGHETHDHTHSHAHTKSVLNRLSRAVGHLTSVRTMVEQGRDCSEVLIQLAAVRAAINKTCEVILKDHLEHCIVDAMQTGDTETLDDLRRAVELLMK
ncbi:MAG: metal-sensing transcriptional repressor [Clostridiales bacterium]|nr:metal-sensing transcriptional repressor [Clostridiales bacterium]